MNPTDKKWQRLAAAARQAPDERDSAAPYGFAARVAARAQAAAPEAGLPLERLAFRAFGVACLLAVLGFLLNLNPAAQPAAAPEDWFFMTEDPAAILLEIS